MGRFCEIHCRYTALRISPYHCAEGGRSLIRTWFPTISQLPGENKSCGEEGSYHAWDWVDSLVVLPIDMSPRMIEAPKGFWEAPWLYPQPLIGQWYIKSPALRPCVFACRRLSLVVAEQWPQRGYLQANGLVWSRICLLYFLSAPSQDVC
jgi:hypothetical protein